MKWSLLELNFVKVIFKDSAIVTALYICIAFLRISLRLAKYCQYKRTPTTFHLLLEKLGSPIEKEIIANVSFLFGHIPWQLWLKSQEMIFLDLTRPDDWLWKNWLVQATVLSGQWPMAGRYFERWNSLLTRFC